MFVTVIEIVSVVILLAMYPYYIKPSVCRLIFDLINSEEERQNLLFSAGDKVGNSNNRLFALLRPTSYEYCIAFEIEHLDSRPRPLENVM